jgi:hypothetical protein
MRSNTPQDATLAPSSDTRTPRSTNHAHDRSSMRLDRTPAALGAPHVRHHALSMRHEALGDPLESAVGSSAWKAMDLRAHCESAPRRTEHVAATCNFQRFRSLWPGTWTDTLERSRARACRTQTLTAHAHANALASGPTCSCPFAWACDGLGLVSVLAWASTCSCPFSRVCVRVHALRNPPARWLERRPRTPLYCR